MRRLLACEFLIIIILREVCSSDLIFEAMARGVITEGIGFHIAHPIMEAPHAPNVSSIPKNCSLSPNPPKRFMKSCEPWHTLTILEITSTTPQMDQVSFIFKERSLLCILRAKRLY